MRHQRKLRRSAGTLLLCACIGHILALIVGLLAFHEIVASKVRQDVSWGQILDALGEAGLLPLFLALIAGQIAFGAITSTSGTYLLRTSSIRVDLAIGLLILGIFAIVFSLLLFGGITGVFAGGLSVAAGIVAFAAIQPRPVVWAVYPTFGQPPPLP